MLIKSWTENDFGYSYTYYQYDDGHINVRIECKAWPKNCPQRFRSIKFKSKQELDKNIEETARKNDRDWILDQIHKSTME